MRNRRRIEAPGYRSSGSEGLTDRTSLADVPEATFTHTASIAQPEDEVWSYLQTSDAWAQIGPLQDVWDAVHEGDELKSYRWRTTVGPTRYDGTAVVVAAARPELMRLDLDAGEVAGSLETRLSANGDGTTQIAVTLTVVSRGMLSTLFFPVVSEAIGRGLPEQVDRFARSLNQ